MQYMLLDLPRRPGPRAGAGRDRVDDGRLRRLHRTAQARNAYVDGARLASGRRAPRPCACATAATSSPTARSPRRRNGWAATTSSRPHRSTTRSQIGARLPRREVRFDRDPAACERAADVEERIARCFRDDAGRAVAALARAYGDLDARRGRDPRRVRHRARALAARRLSAATVGVDPHDGAQPRHRPAAARARRPRKARTARAPGRRAATTGRRAGDGHDAHRRRPARPHLRVLSSGIRSRSAHRADAAHARAGSPPKRSRTRFSPRTRRWRNASCA